MGEHHRVPDDDTARLVEVKVVVASLVTLVASIVVAVLNAALADSRILGALPWWAQFLLLAAAPPVLTFLAGYRQPSNRL
jgi:CHASE2 domain-containing sensor protein